MLVAAVYHADKSWYRARVVEAPSAHNITVHFVDYGNQEKVDWKETAKLVDQFLHIPEMVMLNR